MNDFFNFTLKEIFEYISEVQAGKRKYRVIDLKIIKDKSINMDFHIYSLEDGTISNTISGNARFKTKEDAEGYVIWKAQNNIGIYSKEYLKKELKKIKGYQKEKNKIIKEIIDHEMEILRIAIDDRDTQTKIMKDDLKKLEKERKYL